MAYSDKVIDHYENPRNVGSFDKVTIRWALAWLARPRAET